MFYLCISTCLDCISPSCFVPENKNYKSKSVNKVVFHIIHCGMFMHSELPIDRLELWLSIYYSHFYPYSIDIKITFISNYNLLFKKVFPGKIILPHPVLYHWCRRLGWLVCRQSGWRVESLGPPWLSGTRLSPGILGHGQTSSSPV